MWIGKALSMATCATNYKFIYKKQKNSIFSEFGIWQILQAKVKFQFSSGELAQSVRAEES